MGGKATTTTTIPVALPPPHLITDGGEARQPGKANHPMYGKVPANAFQSGYAANHPMYGKEAANAMTINVYSPDGKLILFLLKLLLLSGLISLELRFESILVQVKYGIININF